MIPLRGPPIRYANRCSRRNAWRSGSVVPHVPMCMVAVLYGFAASEPLLAVRGNGDMSKFNWLAAQSGCKKLMLRSSCLDFYGR